MKHLTSTTCMTNVSIKIYSLDFLHTSQVRISKRSFYNDVVSLRYGKQWARVPSVNFVIHSTMEKKVENHNGVMI